MKAKRIPSSFTSKAITEGEYIWGYSGSKLSNTKIPASLSVRATTCAPARSLNSRSNAPKAVSKVRSDNPTVLLTGAADFKLTPKVSKGRCGTAITRVDSAAPTALVAPADYVHMYKAAGPAKIVGGTAAKSKVSKGGPPARDTLAVVPSEAPTALIAPNDYEHIFCAPEPTPQKLAKVVSKAAVLSEVQAPAGKMQKAKTVTKKETGGISIVANTVGNNQQPQQQNNHLHNSLNNPKKDNSNPNLVAEKTGEGGGGGSTATDEQDESGTCCLIM